MAVIFDVEVMSVFVAIPLADKAVSSEPQYHKPEIYNCWVPWITQAR